MGRLIVAAMLGSTLALGACGGDEGDDGGQSARLSAAEYRSQLTQLCLESEREASQIGGVQGANAAALAEYFDKIAAVQTKRRQRFERLRPPPDLQDEHSQIAPLLVREIAAIEQAAARFRSGGDPVGTYETFRANQNKALRRQSRLLEKLRVPECRSEQGTAGSPAQGSS